MSAGAEFYRYKLSAEREWGVLPRQMQLQTGWLGKVPWSQDFKEKRES